MSSRRSKFQDLLDQHEIEQTIEEPQPVPTRTAEQTLQSNNKALAKSKNPDFTAVTIYVRKDTYQKLQMRLLAQGRRREVSELTNELFEAWLIGQK
jgi:hypothetical protein